jgi:uncharacterized protein Usg
MSNIGNRVDQKQRDGISGHLGLWSRLIYISAARVEDVSLHTTFIVMKFDVCLANHKYIRRKMIQPIHWDALDGLLIINRE